MIPAFKLLDPPVTFSAGQLIMWSLALAFIGVFCAVPLRTQTILREKLRFPSGTAQRSVLCGEFHDLDALRHHPSSQSWVSILASFVTVATGITSKPVGQMARGWCEPWICLDALRSVILAPERSSKATSA